MQSFRVLQGKPASVTITMTDQNGSPVAVGTTPTAVVASLVGATVTPTVVAGQQVGEFALSFAAPDTAALDIWAVSLTDAAMGNVETAQVEVVGGYFFSLPDAREADGNLRDTDRYDDDTLLRARLAVETEFETILGYACVPRITAETATADSPFELPLTWPYLRAVRALTVHGQALTSDQMSDLTLTPDGVLSSDLGAFTAYQPYATSAVYEHGLDAPPADIVEVAIARMREKVNKPTSGIPANATTFAAGEGGTFALASPGRDWSPTGNLEVDAVLLRRRLRGTVA